jgi:hypothetical protein
MNIFSVKNLQNFEMNSRKCHLFLATIFIFSVWNFYKYCEHLSMLKLKVAYSVLDAATLVCIR